MVKTFFFFGKSGLHWVILLLIYIVVAIIFNNTASQVGKLVFNNCLFKFQYIDVKFPF